ncbi:MAG: DUF4443 domain-containing protein [Candidatus Altiarchaeota archaeon]|nr:DUF4443 domain-containing protein [Candidatus Altiarchaeota archaeon]
MVGAAPSFSDVHVVRALFILRGKAVGRKKLVKELGVGEGSVRTILGRLMGKGLIASGKLGHRLTKKGEELVEDYLRGFTPPEPFELDGMESLTAEGMHHSLVVVHNAADEIKSGMEQRDTAFSMGARGVLIMVYTKKTLTFPTPEVGLSDFPWLLEALSSPELQDNDVIVISFAEDYPKAEDGAVAVALSLT